MHHDQLVQVTLSNLSYVNGSGVMQELLEIVADIAGIPARVIHQTMHQTINAQSLLPLRRLLASAAVPKANGLKYKCGIKQLRGSRHLQSQVALQLTSSRGRLALTIDMQLGERHATLQHRQQANVIVHYLADTGNGARSSRHELKFEREQLLTDCVAVRAVAA